MDNAIQHHFGRSILFRKKLLGGISYETWLLILDDGKKVVFRAGDEYYFSGKRKIINADIFERERFFYNTLNKNMEMIFPVVYVVDSTLKYFEKPFQISSCLEGESLSDILILCNKEKKKLLFEKLGQKMASMHHQQINRQHKYILERGRWNTFIARRVEERLVDILNSNLIIEDEIQLITGLVRNTSETGNFLSYLHMDLRPNNIIVCNDNLYIVDAENSEWGDPYFELARMDATGILNKDIQRGYMKFMDIERLNLNSVWYEIYLLESLAFILHVYLYECKIGSEVLNATVWRFKSIKEKIMLIANKG